MVVWASAWLHGTAASDDVLDALQVWAEAHEVRAAEQNLAARLELPGPEDTPAGPALLLASLRKAGASRGELVMPVAGDVRGLDGATAFSRTALSRGEAAVLADAGLGLVPQRPDPAAEGILRWTVFELGDMPPAEHLPLGEAEHGMSSAMREAASALTDLDIAKHRPGVRAEIAETVSARPDLSWPEGVPQRSLRILQRASEVEAILWAATDDTPGGALSASATRARTDALRPLFDSVRAARRSAVAEMVRVLAERAEHH
ncbi:hypothetical protein DFQ14_102310 [Halopolyspora algeriensis]|uniref:Uncharacterized protein n=1 Tax=Halopolyspora algeriensis TaxID=1500506 RepID=A0A368W1Z8_9ACTN|nr:hypothetical protein [Halopolyspora algeriensis]RCW46008.1 hypothetical protein DFQ14_102310 [Halopolyspora algeriensis]